MIMAKEKCSFFLCVFAFCIKEFLYKKKKQPLFLLVVAVVVVVQNSKSASDANACDFLVDL